MTKRIIEEEELLQLLNDSEMLAALESGGVDNWEWYGDCLDNFKELDKEKVLEKYPEYKS